MDAVLSKCSELSTMDAVLSKFSERSTMDKEVAKLFELAKLENFNEIVHLSFQAYHLMTYAEKCEAVEKLMKDGFFEEMLKKTKEIFELSEN